MQNPHSKKVIKGSFWSRLFHVVVYLFALAGLAIIGAWGFFKLGFTNNKGSVDKNYRYLSSVSEMKGVDYASMNQADRNALWMQQYVKLAAFAKYYPDNARMILEAAAHSEDPTLVDRMIAAATVYTDSVESYTAFRDQLLSLYNTHHQSADSVAIPWMATPEWQMLRESVLKDSALLNEAARLTGVEPRLIVACLVGEQIRLYNSNREIVKQYLGPVKVLSVQSQFSYGVNGIKEHTAIAVERNLKDTSSLFYMGKQYENILDFTTDNHEMERYNRLVDYRNHLYSYLYTGCILHQTMLQWRRSGFDISNRPDILCTLFNVGFSQSHPHDAPRCGGSHIKVAGRTYTFGAIGFDFYFSGDLAEAFPFWKYSFIDDNGQKLTADQVEQIQDNVSDCNRPEKGLEYKQTNEPTTLDW